MSFESPSSSRSDRMPRPSEFASQRPSPPSSSAERPLSRGVRSLPERRPSAHRPTERRAQLPQPARKLYEPFDFSNEIRLRHAQEALDDEYAASEQRSPAQRLKAIEDYFGDELDVPSAGSRHSLGYERTTPHAFLTEEQANATTAPVPDMDLFSRPMSQPPGSRNLAPRNDIDLPLESYFGEPLEEDLDERDLADRMSFRSSHPRLREQDLGFIDTEQIDTAATSDTRPELARFSSRDTDTGFPPRERPSQEFLSRADAAYQTTESFSPPPSMSQSLEVDGVSAEIQRLRAEGRVHQQEAAEAQAKLEFLNDQMQTRFQADIERPGMLEKGALFITNGAYAVGKLFSRRVEDKLESATALLQDYVTGTRSYPQSQIKDATFHVSPAILQRMHAEAAALFESATSKAAQCLETARGMEAASQSTPESRERAGLAARLASLDRRRASAAKNAHYSSALGAEISGARSYEAPTWDERSTKNTEQAFRNIGFSADEARAMARDVDQEERGADRARRLKGSLRDFNEELARVKGTSFDDLRPSRPADRQAIAPPPSGGPLPKIDRAALAPPRLPSFAVEDPEDTIYMDSRPDATTYFDGGSDTNPDASHERPTKRAQRDLVSTLPPAETPEFEWPENELDRFVGDHELAGKITSFLEDTRGQELARSYMEMFSLYPRVFEDVRNQLQKRPDLLEMLTKNRPSEEELRTLQTHIRVLQNRLYPASTERAAERAVLGEALYGILHAEAVAKKYQYAA